MNPPCLRESAEGFLLALKVQPRASRNAVQGMHGQELKICVTAPPVDSAANDALLRFLAELLGSPKNSVQLVRGETSRHKTVAIRGVARKEIIRKLGLG